MYEEKLVSYFYLILKRSFSRLLLSFIQSSLHFISFTSNPPWTFSFPLSLSLSTLPYLLLSPSISIYPPKSSSFPLSLSTLPCLLHSPSISVYHNFLPSLSLYLLWLIFISPPFTRSSGPFNPVTSGLRLLHHIMTYPSPRRLPPSLLLFLPHSLTHSLSFSLPPFLPFICTPACQSFSTPPLFHSLFNMTLHHSSFTLLWPYWLIWLAFHDFIMYVKCRHRSQWGPLKHLKTLKVWILSCLSTQ